MTETHRERRVHPRKSLGTRLFNSVLYKPRCKNSMHKWLHWRCPLLTESFACHSSPGMTLVLGTLIPFVISGFFICPCMAISISDHNLRSCHCNNSIMHVYCALAQARPTMPCICLVKRTRLLNSDILNVRERSSVHKIKWPWGEGANVVKKRG